MRVLALTKYPIRGSSSRLRFEQYFPALREAGIRCDCEPLFDPAYLERLFTGRPRHYGQVAARILRRMRILRSADAYDLLWIEGETLPWLPDCLENLLLPDLPFVLDYDDARFHIYDCHRSAFVRWGLGRKLDHMMARARMVFVGNEYLARRARRAGAPRVEFVPTVLRIEDYRLEASREGAADGYEEPGQEGGVTIGWIGTPLTAEYLKPLKPVLSRLARERRIRVLLVGTDGVDAWGSVDFPLECVRWTQQDEVDQIRRMDLGIMPLPDEPFTRGKCGYKLLQYMAMALPTVASPVGVNPRIVRAGQTGFLASSADEWHRSLLRLIDDAAMRRAFGRAGRKIVESDYSLTGNVAKVERFLREACNGRGASA